MALIYITGAPGSGKTTLQIELNRLGYDARDLDNSGFGGPHNKTSGERVVIPPIDQRSPDWFDAHEWRVYPTAIDALRVEAQTKDIFLCGVAASDGEVLHLFDQVIYLELSDDALRHRLDSRENNDFGKNDFEAHDILDRKRDLDKRYSTMRATKINVEGSLTKVVREVLRCC